MGVGFVGGTVVLVNGPRGGIWVGAGFVASAWAATGMGRLCGPAGRLRYMRETGSSLLAGALWLVWLWCGFWLSIPGLRGDWRRAAPTRMGSTYRLDLDAAGEALTTQRVHTQEDEQENARRPPSTRKNIKYAPEPNQPERPG